ncbi:MAG: hypothetical protein ACD_46C00064G0002 [uncultured bacterium]|nr:MAG: hypothetical protein ACD_46C00064G0002 [uncultured bacterium]OGT47599.1 MAG: hypothetical protein A3E83_06875 [Gammaproteobacteria bacterium RIFCSPHIGHO2_12_FULL_41_20]HLB43516.1 HAD-IA family hydrolase [Gammaproteobacteria bacterium]
MTIKNIILDLGGVILNIDFQRTYTAFRDLGACNLEKLYSANSQDSVFEDFELGKISADFFRATVKNKLAMAATDSQFDQAWNAMILDLPESRLDFIRLLKKKYKLFLLSNANQIHIDKVLQICQVTYGYNPFQSYFDNYYFSNIIGKRKPDANAFLHVLEESKIQAQETLFIDDTMQNIQSAQNMGLNVAHVERNNPAWKSIHLLS